MKTGPASSYKRVRKAEKNKKKLKTALKNVATKTQLPKGQNLTDTNFKVKKIVIRDQVKPHDEDEILYRKKLNVAELTARLAHHNSTIKTEALDGLKDMIATHPVEVLGSHYIQVLESVVKLVLDDTSTIRKSACKIVGQILSAIARHKLVPVFASLNSYLLCGLTHIDRGVREDSLVLMDAFLKYVPELCEKYAFNLLSVCLDLISEKGVASRTLSLNLDSSQIASKWRAKVLERISSLLHCLLVGIPNAAGNSGKATPDKIFVPGDVNHFPIFTEIPRNNSIYTEQNPEENSRKVTASEFAEAMIPLLLGMYLEINPSEKSTAESNLSTVINEESSKLLTLIIDIIQTIWDILENLSDSENIKRLSKRYSNSLLQTLVAGRFPYSVSNRSARRNQNTDDGDNSLSINLSIARLVVVFTEQNNWDAVLPFLKNCFRMAEQFSSFETVTFAACVKKICREDGFSDKDYFFSKIVSISLDGQSQLCPFFFRILGDVALSTTMRHFHGHPDFEKWLASLPERLTRDRFQPYQLDIISKVAVRNFPSFTASLDVNIELILDNIPKVSVVDDAKKDVVRWQMATLLHWVQDWDEELTASLEPAIRNCYWGDRLTKYISEIISVKDACAKRRPLKKKRPVVSNSDSTVKNPG